MHGRSRGGAGGTGGLGGTGEVRGAGGAEGEGVATREGVAGGRDSAAFLLAGEGGGGVFLITRYGQIDKPEAFPQKARRYWKDSLWINILERDQADRGVRRCANTTT